MNYNNSNNNSKANNSTNKIKNNTNLRRLFKQNKIINNVLLKIYPFNSEILDIIKFDITYNNEIII